MKQFQKRVNWEEQWELFAENFKEGKAHIDLKPYGGLGTLLLTPGPGFGDLSHPTTYLMLEMMKGRVDGESIIDVGTGSGILALASLLLGAKSAVGIDIDPEALRHARKNSKLNHLEKRLSLSKKIPKKIFPSNIVLMNMILSEQTEVNPQKFNSHAKLWIVSGILAERKQEYLTQIRLWGWSPISEYQRAEWVGWIFQCGAGEKSSTTTSALPE